MHQWHYMKTTMLGEDQVGPVSEDELKRLSVTGKLKSDSKLLSQTRTKGQWVYLKNVPSLLQLVEKGAAERAIKKQQAKDAKLAEKKIQKEASSLAKAEGGDGPDPRAVKKIKDHVTGFLTRDEEIELVCVQVKPVAIKADAVVATNRRLMIVRPKLLGRFDFSDMLWRDLGDAHIKDNIIGSTFSMRHCSGEVVSIDMLAKKQARKLYQIAQEREEQAIEIRRTRQMEESSAGATQINMGAQQPPPSVPQAATGPMERLKQLKEMLDAGLIDQVDFDKRKGEILGDI